MIGSLVSIPALAQQTANVTISNGSGLGQLCVAARNCFNGRVLHIETGATVNWMNIDKFSHTVTSGSPNDSQVGTIFDSGLIAPGKQFSFTFTKAGIYHYFCEIHPWMRGEVDVTQKHLG